LQVALMAPMVQIAQTQPECMLLIDMQFKENSTFFEGNWCMTSMGSFLFFQQQSGA
jgi:hypothetical protein